MRLSQGGSELRLPVASIAARKFFTVVPQQYDFSCGSAALATLLSYQYGNSKTEPDVFVGMWNKGDQAQIRALGFSLLDMKRYLLDLGLTADGYRVSLDQIRASGIPGIALVTVRGYRHFVVVKGITPAGVLIGDPAMGLRSMLPRDFEKVWNGVYFVLTNAAAKGRFNDQRDWSLAPGARYLLAMEPLSLQALSLMSPSFGQP
jgi:predicted double-glycine peptidase